MAQGTITKMSDVHEGDYYISSSGLAQVVQLRTASGTQYALDYKMIRKGHYGFASIKGEDTLDVVSAEYAEYLMNLWMNQ